MRLIEEHSWLIGKVAKLHSSAGAIEQGYTEAIGIGDVDKIDKLYWRCHCGGPYEISFMFVDEQPFRRLGVVFYCLQEIGNGVFGDWHWFSLEQLIVCD